MSGILLPPVEATPRQMVEAIAQVIPKDGTFTATAGLTSTVTDFNATPNSRILLTPLSAAAAALAAYVTVKGTEQFIVGHSTALGTEAFDYLIIN